MKKKLPRRLFRFARAVLWAGAALGVAGAVLFAVSWCMIDAPLEAAGRYPAGLVLRDREGTPLRVWLGPDDTDCRPGYVPSREDWIVRAIVASEDRRFFRHHGADLLSLARALWQNATNLRRVSGASTLTQQAARLIEPHPRTLRSKWIELVQALKIERARSKDWILAQYLDRAPFGANYVGIEAAARGWFDKAPADLSLGEAALLAGIVQAPSRFRPDRHMDRAVVRRDYVLGRMAALGLATPEQLRAAAAAPPALRRERRPFRAPHYADWARRTLVPEGAYDVRTPLDPAAQTLAERAVARGAASSGGQCAAVVLDAATGDVRAMACSGDFFRDPAGQFNIALAPRPAGSTLKPFFFARALDRGLLAPTEALPDLPFTIGSFRPANFGGGHRGRVRADEALVLSLNLPFYEIVRRLGVEDACALLRGAGLLPPDDDPATHGLGIAVGNADVSLLTLAQAYAALARAAAGATNGPASPEAAWLVSDLLSGPERSLAALGHLADVPLPRAAWKTGTSAAFRDAWTVLWTPEEVVAVRCGHRAWHFGDRSIVGAGAAAPVAWELFRALHPDGRAPWFGPPPSGLVRRRVCAASGLPASPDCPETREEWALQGRSSARPCPVHVRGPDGAVVERWTGPLALPGAGDAPDGPRAKLRIARPADGASLRFAGGPPWKVACRAQGIEEGAELWWTLDGVPSGRQRAALDFFAICAEPGPHTVTCAAADGTAATVRFTIEAEVR